MPVVTAATSSRAAIAKVGAELCGSVDDSRGVPRLASGTLVPSLVPELTQSVRSGVVVDEDL
jgi:hypothetical protein